MVAYVVDAAREATGGRPLVVTSPATAAVRDALGGDVDYALQAEPRGTGDAVAGRDRGPRPTTSTRSSSSSATCRSSRPGLLTRAARGTPPRRGRDRPRRRRRDRAGQSRPGHPRRSRHRRPDRRAQGRDRRGARGQRDQLRPLRLRRGLAARADRLAQAVAEDRRAVPDRARRARSRGRPARRRR